LTDGQRAAGKAVDARRGELRFTQQDLADLSGASVRAIRDFENGVSWPHSKNRIAIAKALGWPVKAPENGHGIDELQRIADDVDQSQMSAFLTTDREAMEVALSDLPEETKRRIVARMWTERGR